MSRTKAHFIAWICTWGAAFLGLVICDVLLNATFDLKSLFNHIIPFAFFFWMGSGFVVSFIWLVIALPYSVIILRTFPQSPFWVHALVGFFFGFLALFLLSLAFLFSLLGALSGAIGAGILAKFYQHIDFYGSNARFSFSYFFQHMSTQFSPTQLIIYFDGQCGLCSQARQWLEKEPLSLPLMFENLHSSSGKEELSSCPLDAKEKLLVSDGAGNWWQGGDAWIMILWATQRYAHWAHKFAHPRWRPLLRHLVDNISNHRHGLSRLLGLKPTESSLQQLEANCREDREGCNSTQNMQ